METFIAEIIVQLILILMFSTAIYFMLWIGFKSCKISFLKVAIGLLIISTISDFIDVDKKITKFFDKKEITK